MAPLSVGSAAESRGPQRRSGSITISPPRNKTPEATWGPAIKVAIVRVCVCLHIVCLTFLCMDFSAGVSLSNVNLCHHIGPLRCGNRPTFLFSRVKTPHTGCGFDSRFLWSQSDLMESPLTIRPPDAFRSPGLTLMSRTAFRVSLIPSSLCRSLSVDGPEVCTRSCHPGPSVIYYSIKSKTKQLSEAKS